MVDEERGRRLARAQRRMRDEPAQERQVRRHAGDLGLGERSARAGRAPRRASRRARSAWRSSGRRTCRPRRPPRRPRRRGPTPAAAAARSGRPAAGTCADPRRTAAPRRRAPRARRRRRARSPRAIAQLLLDEVEARHGLGHRMLDLDAAVQLEEVERRGPRARTRRCPRRRSRRPGRTGPRRRSSRARKSGSSATDGDSSSTFWWRRCTEHSRSPSASTVPCVSASSWISTCRGRSR